MTWHRRSARGWHEHAIWGGSAGRQPCRGGATALGKDDLYKEGVQLTHQRKYELARAKFVEAIALDANDAEAVLTVAVAPGGHVVAVAGAGGPTQSVEVGAGGNVSVTLVAAVDPVVAPVVPVVADVHAVAGEATPPASDASGGGWSGAKIGTVAGLGALAITGIVVGVLENSARSSRDDDAKALGSPPPNCPANPGSATCAKLADLKSSYDSDQRLATALIVSGAVLAAGAAAAAIFWPNKSGSPATQSGLHVAPIVGVTTGGIQLSASF